MIAYHGTNLKAAKSIKREGFRKGTYFAFRKGEAIKFGLCVFTVEFSDEPTLWKVGGGLMDLSKAGTDKCWQFHTTIPIKINKIKEYKRYLNYGICTINL